METTYTEKIKAHGVKPITTETIARIRVAVADFRAVVDAVQPVNETHAITKKNALAACDAFLTDDPEFWAELQYRKNVNGGLDARVLVQSVLNNIQ